MRNWNSRTAYIIPFERTKSAEKDNYTLSQDKIIIDIYDTHVSGKYIIMDILSHYWYSVAIIKLL